MLGHAGLLASTAAVGLPVLAAAGAEPAPAPRKLKIVVTGGHPGDPECGCGGTIARYTDAGHEVTLLYLNRGEPDAPTHLGVTGVRTAEAQRACEILKAHAVFARQIDGHAIVDPTHYAEFREMLERERPDVVFTHWPIDNHADHRAMSNLVYDAWFKGGKRFALYYYEVSNGEDTVQFAPTHYVDITATEPRKRQACFAHASQRPEKFYALQETITKMRGIESGHAQAEGYIRHVQSPDFGLPAAT